MKKKLEKKAEKKIVKRKTGKKSQLEKMKTEEREKANELWAKTAKDGKEHAKVTNSRTVYEVGDQHGVYIRPHETPYKAQHTHPGWDAPLSGADIAGLLKQTKCVRQSASSSKRIFVATRTKDTKWAAENFQTLSKKFKDVTDDIYRKAVVAHKKKTRGLLTERDASRIWGDSILEMNKKVAKEYNFDYVSFTRK